MKLLNLDPVTYATTPEEEAYISRFLSPDVTLVSRCAEGAPETIESEYEQALAAPCVARACVKAEEDGFDGVFVDCFGDPGVRAARELVGIPVFGGFEPSVLSAMALADRFAIITVVRNVIPTVRANVARAGAAGRVVRIDSVDIPVLELRDKDRLIEALYAKSRTACVENGAEAIVLGCTAMLDIAERLQKRLRSEGLDIPVIEPAHAALSLLESCARLGYRHSGLTYPVPARVLERRS